MSGLEESPAQTANSLPSERSLPLFMLAFDHRRSIRGLFGIAAEPTAADAGRIAAAKLLILDGLLAARERLDSGAAAVLVDEQFGAAVLDAARDRGMVTAVACERSGQAEFQLEYGDAFAAHIERFDPTFVKALVRFNPGGDAELNERQLERLRALGEQLASAGRALLFELLVPPEPDQLRELGGSRERYDAELRPELVRRAVTTIQDAGIEPALWKIEGIEQRSDCELIAAACRRAGASGSAVSSSAAARTRRRSSTGCGSPRPSRASRGSPSGARSGGTRSPPTSPATSTMTAPPARSPIATCTSSTSTAARRPDARRRPARA